MTVNKKMNFIASLLCLTLAVQAQDRAWNTMLEEADKEVARLMKKGNIPGLSLVMVSDNRQVIRNYGYANKETKTPVTASTLFEIGSCTKAFTALAAAVLIREGKLNPDAALTDYLPWLELRYEGKAQKVTIAHLLRHTSGIPWNTISKITPLSGKGALEQQVRRLEGQALKYVPGTTYEYATINYDVLALVIQVVAGEPFESYLQQNIINALQLSDTRIGKAADPAAKAIGYKGSFFGLQPYAAPDFGGNYAAGYVVSNATDMAKWLQFQMGLSPSPLTPAALLTQQRDESVPLHNNNAAYGMGWEIPINGTGEINHSGFNPNFTAYVAFRPKQKIGIVILANAASNYTPYIGDRILKLVSGSPMGTEFDPGDGGNSGYSTVAIILGVFMLGVLCYFFLLYRDLRQKNRYVEGVNLTKIRKIIAFPLVILPFAFAIYLMPKALASFNWDTVFIWSPFTLKTCLGLLAAAVGISFIAYATSFFFPAKNTMRGKMPLLLLLGILAGFANMAVIVLISSSLNSNVELKYLVFFYVLISLFYLAARRYVQVQLIRFSRGLTYELRTQLTEKIFSTSYQRFEKIDRGRVYTGLNDDVGTIGESTNVIIVLVTSLITAIGAFIFLASIAFWATLITVGMILIIATAYYFTGNATVPYFDQARSTQARFMNLVSGMVDGYKEISLSHGKKMEYKAEVNEVASQFRDKIVTASIRFVNVSLFGDLFLITILGVVTFGFPKIFPSIQSYTIRSFIVVLLYLIGPINAILNSVPAVLQVKVAWRRIQQFLKDIPANLNLKETPPPIPARIEHFEADQLEFGYKTEQGSFDVGPISFTVRRGEILFIIGGNGSGKTTLAKLLTGLYEPDQGVVRINNMVVPTERLGGYFSAVFSPAFLFEKIYNINLDGKEEEVTRYLQMLGLEDKVTVTNNTFSTLNLSGGQRKRLALLLCYLEDSPIYLFDEWAADQDPDYRRFFYRTLLPRMREAGKIVLAVTHDDHYFDVADKVIKMNQGQLEIISDTKMKDALLVEKA